MKWWLTAEPKDQDLLVTCGLQFKIKTLKNGEWTQMMKSSNYLMDSKLRNDSSQVMKRFGCSVVEVEVKNRTI